MSVNDPKYIQISLAAIAKMVKFDLSKPGTETVGLLIGYEKDGIVYVEDVRLGDQTGNAVHVQVSEMELTQAAIEISERNDNFVIVGWIHTHPGLSAFLSSTDIKTQSLYQAFMPNAIAIVMDPVQYGKTHKLDDLDVKVFRVIDDQAVEYRFQIAKSVEFGLNSFVTGEGVVDVNPATPPSKHYIIQVPSRSELKVLRLKLSSIELQIAEEDKLALNAWLDLAEAMESGDAMEVPIEVETLVDRLNSSLGEINDEMAALRQELDYRKAERTLISIFIGLLLEFSIFFFFL